MLDLLLEKTQSQKATFQASIQTLQTQLTNLRATIERTTPPPLPVVQTSNKEPDPKGIHYNELPRQDT